MKKEYKMIESDRHLYRAALIKPLLKEGWTIISAVYSGRDRVEYVFEREETSARAPRMPF